MVENTPSQHQQLENQLKKLEEQKAAEIAEFKAYQTGRQQAITQSRKGWAAETKAGTARGTNTATQSERANLRKIRLRKAALSSRVKYFENKIRTTRQAMKTTSRAKASGRTIQEQKTHQQALKHDAFKKHSQKFGVPKAVQRTGITSREWAEMNPASRRAVQSQVNRRAETTRASAPGIQPMSGRAERRADPWSVTYENGEPRYTRQFSTQAEADRYQTVSRDVRRDLYKQQLTATAHRQYRGAIAQRESTLTEAKIKTPKADKIVESWEKPHQMQEYKELGYVKKRLKRWKQGFTDSGDFFRTAKGGQGDVRTGMELVKSGDITYHRTSGAIANQALIWGAGFRGGMGIMFKGMKWAGKAGTAVKYAPALSRLRPSLEYPARLALSAATKVGIGTAAVLPLMEANIYSIQQSRPSYSNYRRDPAFNELVSKGIRGGGAYGIKTKDRTILGTEIKGLDIGLVNKNIFSRKGFDESFRTASTGTAYDTSEARAAATQSFDTRRLQLAASLPMAEAAAEIAGGASFARLASRGYKTVGKLPGARRLWTAARPLAGPGFIEGASGGYIENRINLEKVDVRRMFLAGSLGAGMAGGIGGFIGFAKTSPSPKLRTVGRAVDVGAHIADPWEKPGDVIGGAMLKRGGVRGTTFTTSYTSKYRGEVSVGFTPSKPRRTALPSFSPTAPGVPSSTPVFAPTSVTTQTSAVLPSIVPSFTPSKVPSMMPSMVPTAVPSSVPSSVPSMTPSMVPTMVPTTVPSTVPGPVSIPTTVTTGGLAGFLPIGNFIDRRRRRRKKGGRVKSGYGYAPGLQSIEMGITAPAGARIPKSFTGMEIRPIIVPKTSSRRAVKKTPKKRKKKKTSIKRRSSRKKKPKRKKK